MRPFLASPSTLRLSSSPAASVSLRRLATLASPDLLPAGSTTNPSLPLNMVSQTIPVSSSVRPTTTKLQQPPKAVIKAGYFSNAFNHELHAQRSLEQLRSKTEPLEKYIFLNSLKERDPGLFYSLLGNNLTEFTPLVYTPVIGSACLNYSHIFRRNEGLVLSYKDKGQIKAVLQSWSNVDQARIAVVTDGSRILGLGDLGVNGLPISLGKLDLYIAGAGLRPQSTLPICLDLGTNTQKYLDDPLYLGLRQKRVSHEEMKEFMDEFMTAMREVFPKLVVQFEDFSTDNAFFYLSEYQNRFRCFNDDIQGTGSVVLSGFINAASIASADPNGPSLRDHKILFLGAGSAGIGVAKQLTSFFKLQGLSEEEARSRIWTVDTKGLVYNGRPGVTEHKKYFSRNDYSGPPMKSLKDIVEHVKPTALFGLSTNKNAFTEEVVRLMSSLNSRPIIFPLSNPSSLCELEYEDAVRWTDGRVVFASGSPYSPTTHNGHKYEPGQGNNMYVFPGIGLGSVLSAARTITDGMVERASLELAASVTVEEKAAGLIYPRLTRIRDVSALIARGVIRQAQKESVDENVALRGLSDQDLLHYVQDKMWNPPQLNKSRL